MGILSHHHEWGRLVGVFIIFKFRIHIRRGIDRDVTTVQVVQLQRHFCFNRKSMKLSWSFKNPIHQRRRNSMVDDQGKSNGGEDPPEFFNQFEIVWRSFLWESAEVNSWNGMQSLTLWVSGFHEWSTGSCVRSIPQPILYGILDSFLQPIRTDIRDFRVFGLFSWWMRSWCFGGEKEARVIPASD